MLLICSKTPRVQKKSWNTHVAFKTFRSVLYSWPSTVQTPLSDAVNTTEDSHPPSQLLTFHSSDHSPFSAQKSFLTLHSCQDQILSFKIQAWASFLPLCLLPTHFFCWRISFSSHIKYDIWFIQITSFTLTTTLSAL